jgi:putative CocE/NonD family hydrolase
MEPGRVYQVTVDLQATSNVFLPGHRIRVEVSSSNFPRFDRNPNVAIPVCDATEDDLRCARQRVHHGPETASRLVLSVMPDA